MTTGIEVQIHVRRYTRPVLLALAVVFIANVLIRLIFLGDASFWYDEMVCVKATQEHFGHLKHISEWDNNPPFYYYCLWVWTHLFGISEWAVRSLSVLFSALAAVVLYATVSRFANPIAAIHASVFYLASNVIYYYSHEARAYALTVLLALCSVNVFLRALEKPGWGMFLLLGLLNFLLVYTHYIPGLVWVLEGLWLTLVAPRAWKYFSVSCLLTLLLVWLRFTSKQFLLILGFGSKGFWLAKSSPSYLWEVVLEFFGNHAVIATGMLLLFVLEAVWLWKSRRNTASHFLVFCLLMGLGPLVILYVVGIFTPLFLDRYILFAVPFLLVLPAHFLSRLNGVLAPLLMTAFMVSSFWLIDYRTPKPMDYKRAVPVVQQLKTPETLVLVSTKDLGNLFTYYYSREIFEQENSEERMKKEQVYFVSTAEDLPANWQQYPRIIFTSSFAEYGKAPVAALLSRQYARRYDVRSFRGVGISLFLH